ncbi:MAG: hypothetical protein WC934_06855 [Acidithiobacillus sp.]|jgi:hypothetical protein|uniref:hypothetical protein n=1 Tax=Acidithiobacillus sp. TaxID=1872118 RepID=UPI00355EBF34
MAKKTLPIDEIDDTPSENKNDDVYKDDDDKDDEIIDEEVQEESDISISISEEEDLEIMKALPSKNVIKIFNLRNQKTINQILEMI